MDIVKSIDINQPLADPSATYSLLDPGYIFERMVEFFQWLFKVIFNHNTGELLNGIFIFLALFFIAIITYSFVRMFEIRKKERAHLRHELEEYAHHQAEKEKNKREKEAVSKNERWVKILEYLSSSNVNDWKLSVIEADSMLDGLMKDLGFKGESLGDRLKNADRDKFRNLTSAWDVHTIRNRIAHEGENFDLTLREAKRVIALYEQIFLEFGYI
jgi:hypothetical protein